MTKTHLGPESASSLRNAPSSCVLFPSLLPFWEQWTSHTNVSDTHCMWHFCHSVFKPSSMLQSEWVTPERRKWFREKSETACRYRHHPVGAPIMPVTFLPRSTLIHSLASPRENKMCINTLLESNEEHGAFIWLCWLQLPHTYNNKFLVSLAHMFEQCVAASLTVGDISFVVSKLHREAVCPMKKLTSWVPTFAISHHLQLYPKKIFTEHLLRAQPPLTQRYPKAASTLSETWCIHQNNSIAHCHW